MMNRPPIADPQPLPDALEELIELTPPHTRLAAAALLALLAAAGIWACFGRITSTLSARGLLVEDSAPVAGSPRRARLWLPSEQAPRVTPGMEVRLTPDGAPGERYGALLGRVARVGCEPDPTGAPPHTPPPSSRWAEVELRLDPRTPSGLAWSSGQGAPFALAPGTAVGAEIELEALRPLALVLPELAR